MLQKNRRFLVFLNMLTELAILYGSYLLSHFLRFSVMSGRLSEVSESPATYLLLFGYCCCEVVFFYLFHLYVPVHQSSAAREMTTLVLISIASILTLGTVFYLVRYVDFSRLTLLFFWLSSTGALCVKRVWWRRRSQKRYLEGIGVQHVILVGDGEAAAEYHSDIQANPQYGRRVVGYIGSDPQAGLGAYLGPLDRLGQILESTACDEVVVALEAHESPYIQNVLNTVGREGLRVSMIPFYHSYFPRHPTIETIGRSVLIDMRATPLNNIALAFLKRAFDIVGSAVLLVLLSPLMLAAMIGVRLGSPGPILFRQQRIGLDRQEFTMYKFRSMRVNAEENTGWSKTSDPRRTRFGSFIRKYSIDELPQLFNVLRGDMSLVGPRPELPYFVYHFKETVPLYLVRQQVRPGMTGWAQVHGLRGDTSIQARVKYDIWYIENWSPALDIRILFKTLLGGFINNEEMQAGTKAEAADEPVSGGPPAADSPKKYRRKNPVRQKSGSVRRHKRKKKKPAKVK